MDRYRSDITVWSQAPHKANISPRARGQAWFRKLTHPA